MTAYARFNPLDRPNPVANTIMLAPAAPANTQVNQRHQNSRLLSASTTLQLVEFSDAGDDAVDGA